MTSFSSPQPPHCSGAVGTISLVADPKRDLPPLAPSHNCLLLIAPKCLIHLLRCYQCNQPLWHILNATSHPQRLHITVFFSPPPNASSTCSGAIGAISFMADLKATSHTQRLRIMIFFQPPPNAPTACSGAIGAISPVADPKRDLSPPAPNLRTQ